MLESPWQTSQEKIAEAYQIFDRIGFKEANIVELMRLLRKVQTNLVILDESWQVEKPVKHIPNHIFKIVICLPTFRSAPNQL